MNMRNLMHHLLNLLSIALSKCSKNTILRLSTGLTFLFFSVFRLRRSLILKNLRIVYKDQKDERELLSIAFNSYRQFIFTCLEFLSVRDGSLGKDVAIDPESEEILKELKNRNEGGYILCIHMASWEAMGGGLSKKGYPSHVVVKKVGSKKINDMITQLRFKNGFLPIERRKKGDVVRKIRETLEKKEFIGFVMDQARPGEPFLPFFGVPAKTNTSFAAIWRKHPAPIIPGYIVMDEVGHYTVYFKDIIDLEVTDDAEKDILLHSELFNKKVEEMILEKPEQYFWMHDRWKQ